jgi:hypothetical protein
VRVFFVKILTLLEQKCTLSAGGDGIELPRRTYELDRTAKKVQIQDIWRISSGKWPFPVTSLPVFFRAKAIQNNRADPMQPQADSFRKEDPI